VDGGGDMGEKGNLPSPDERRGVGGVNVDVNECEVGNER
jgi:hypothetical protein